MKIYTEVLSEELLNLCKEDILQKQKQRVWGSSSFEWDYNLLESIDGVCLSTEITNDKIIKSLTDELSIAFVNYNYKELLFQYYIWDSYAGISPHDDYSYNFGATIYLNSNNITDGGLFIWQDEECSNNFYRCVNPEENMLIVNDNREVHFVTSVSPHAKEYRYTIQIWGK